ncbi:short-chain dehydrogenase reductase SDR [Roridomyces roridus]|uniref:Short-chain dehydrogenase reductase SDR n=1 Tax=Roridomyces roridus TaxID=1738132 RepID=A0AAD7BTA1_9AGAR|nr:short-chain dehydrogenase reductase SDR [Roridomyces roridus]
MSNTRTVLITGTSSGIGLATAKVFHQNGWNVVATLRNLDAARPELVALAKGDEPRLILERLDVTDAAQIKAAIEAGIRQFGKIDVLVNNAGYAQNGVLEGISSEKVKEQFAVNVFGVMDTIRAILPHFRANGSGGVINISSGAGLWALPLGTMYSGSKFALEGFTEALSYELASQGIFVKSIIPHGGVQETEFATRFIGSTPTEPDSPEEKAQYKEVMDAYGPLVMKVYASRLRAATDGSDRLRYTIGVDKRGFLAKRYNSTSDEDYMQFMRAFFPPVNDEDVEAWKKTQKS